MADRVLTADAENGTLFACVSPGVRFTEGKVADTRLGAFLTPYPDAASARDALAAAGGSNISEGGKR